MTEIEKLIAQLESMSFAICGRAAIALRAMQAETERLRGAGDELRAAADAMGDACNSAIADEAIKAWDRAALAAIREIK